jgi:hypothetical protein
MHKIIISWKGEHKSSFIIWLIKRQYSAVAMCMLLPVLPGPEIIFRPVHEKSSANSGKCLANFRPQILPASFFSPAPLELFGRNFGHVATLAATHPPTPPLPPSLPSLSSHPSHP